MYDIVIIGGGAAGMSAAIYALRGGMKTLLFEKLATGGQAAKTYEIDNYPGFSQAPSGPELMQQFKEHAEKFGVDIRTEAVREIIDIDKPVKIVKTRKGEYETRSVIMATGASPKKLEVSGELEFSGVGVSYCATCDGTFFKDLDTVVIGGGNTAMEDALYLSRFCKSVAILNRSEKFRASKVLLDKVIDDPKITVYQNTVAESFTGTQKLEAVNIKNVITGKTDVITAAGVIIAIGITPDNALAEQHGLELCPRGFIKTDMFLKTSVDGVYAAGDCRLSPLRQVVTAAADGAIAATSAINYLMSST